MNVAIISIMFGYLSICSSLPTDEALKPKLADSVQSKRDLSLSYAATDIGSKEGTRVKTITVIKNVAGKKDKPLKIDPKLHESENWGSHFRDNFSAYGVIPDIPDIDDLFEFVNKKKEKNPKEKDNPPEKKPNEQDNKSEKDDKKSTEEEEEAVTSVSPAPVEEVIIESKDEKVEKISGDAELIQPKDKQGKVKSQSLDFGKYSVRENTFDMDDSTSDEQFLSSSAISGKKREKYIQSPSDSYYYPKPSPGIPMAFLTVSDFAPQQSGRGSISVTTPSGRKYDVPCGNSTDVRPYIAPSFRTKENSPPSKQIGTSSQRPYLAPNVRKSYEAQFNSTDFISNETRTRQQSIFNANRNIPTGIRFDRFGGYKPSLPRSRGLRY